MRLYELLVNTVVIVGGGTLLAMPNGAVGLLIFAGASAFTDNLSSAALFSGVGGVLWAQLLFAVVLPLPFFPFNFPRLPLKQMLGWYIAFGLGYGLGPLVASFVNHLGWMPWPLFASLLCSGALPLLVVGMLQPLGIVGFPNRKFN